MTREEFRVALDMSLSKDRVKLCLDYINNIESRICNNCKYYNGKMMYHKCDIFDFFHDTLPEDFSCSYFEEK